MRVDGAILRGFTLCCVQSDEHAEPFDEMYAAIDESRLVLPHLGQ